jgi:hypothetical protein
MAIVLLIEEIHGIEILFQKLIGLQFSRMTKNGIQIL